MKPVCRTFGYLDQTKAIEIFVPYIGKLFSTVIHTDPLLKKNEHNHAFFKKKSCVETLPDTRIKIIFTIAPKTQTRNNHSWIT